MEGGRVSGHNRTCTVFVKPLNNEACGRQRSFLPNMVVSGGKMVMDLEVAKETETPHGLFSLFLGLPPLYKFNYFR